MNMNKTGRTIRTKVSYLTIFLLLLSLQYEEENKQSQGQIDHLVQMLEQVQSTNNTNNSEYAAVVEEFKRLQQESQTFLDQKRRQTREFTQQMRQLQHRVKELELDNVVQKTKVRINVSVLNVVVMMEMVSW